MLCSIKTLVTHTLSRSLPHPNYHEGDEGGGEVARRDGWQKEDETTPPLSRLPSPLSSSQPWPIRVPRLGTWAASYRRRRHTDVRETTSACAVRGDAFCYTYRDQDGNQGAVVIENIFGKGGTATVV